MAGKRFLDFLDRFDGGGMGQSGDRFEGGGLLSLLGNLVADPYGSEDKARMASRDAFYGAQDIGGPASAPTIRPAPAAVNNNQAAVARPAPPTEAERFYMNPPAPYSPAPVNVGAPPSYMQPSSMKMPAPVGAGTPPSYMQPSSMKMPAPVGAGTPQIPAPEDPLSFEGFARHLIGNYDQGFVRRMLSSPDQYGPAYDLYVRNGGRL